MRYTVNVDPRIQVKDIESVCQLPVYVKFSGGFCEAAASKFCEELAAAEDLCLKTKQEILPIVIDSYGGTVYSLLSMIDAINDCKVPIATVVESKAMSCGAVLFTMGAEGYRFMGPNATLMIHEVSAMAIGKLDELKVSVNEAERLNDKVFKLMARNCGHPEDYFTNLVHERRHADWFLDAEDCVKHNLANHIGTPSVEVSITVEQKFNFPSHMKKQPEKPSKKESAAKTTK